MLVISIATASANIADPVADYRNQNPLIATSPLYKWTADIAGNGYAVMFLSLKEEYDHDKKIDQMPSWETYISSTGGYVPLHALDTGDGFQTESYPQIDPYLMYVGKITQLNKHGIVTAQIDYPKKEDPICYLYAYTVVGDNLKRTLLAKFDPDLGNPHL